MQSCAAVDVATFVEIQSRLDQFQIPVAELSPEEIVDAIGGFMKTIGRKGVIDFRGNAIEARKNPAIFKRARGGNLVALP